MSSQNNIGSTWQQRVKDKVETAVSSSAQSSSSSSREVEKRFGAPCKTPESNEYKLVTMEKGVNNQTDFDFPADSQCNRTHSRDIHSPSFDNLPANRTLSGLSDNKCCVGAIVRARNSINVPPRVKVSGYRTTDNIETCALDSGACEAVLAPHAFSNTQTVRTKGTGTKYQACGGEKVTNTGEKRVVSVDSEGNLFKLDFQCTDKLLET